jgi:hypothetical protein
VCCCHAVADACSRFIVLRAEVEGLMNASRAVPKPKILRMCVTIISVALMSPVAARAMTIECRDLAFGQHLSKLSVAVDQSRATVSSEAGQLLGRYAFEIVHQSADRVVLLGKQSTLPWVSPVVVLSIDLGAAEAWSHRELAGSVEVDRIAGAIEWACRPVE